jgi:hypothetical protein
MGACGDKLVYDHHLLPGFEQKPSDSPAGTEVHNENKDKETD